MLSVAVLAACGDSGQPLAPSTAASGAPRVSAQTEITNEFVPLFGATFVPCANGGAGETVFYEGTLHEVTRATESASGNFSITFHSNPQGVKGTGEITGDIYQGTGSSTATFTMGPGQTVAIASSFQLIGPGTDNNFRLHVTAHLTVNANGEVTSEVDNFSAECS
jgi:hypothetical protein